MLEYDLEVPVGHDHYSGPWNGFGNFVGFNQVIMV
jgi:hypothetical protein